MGEQGKDTSGPRDIDTEYKSVGSEQGTPRDIDTEYKFSGSEQGGPRDIDTEYKSGGHDAFEEGVKDLGNGIYDMSPENGSPIVPNPDPAMEIDPEQIQNREEGVLQVQQNLPPVAPHFLQAASMPDTLLACAVEGFGETVSKAQAGTETAPEEGCDVKGYTA